MARQAQLDAVRPVLNALDAEATAAEHVIDTIVSNVDKATEVVESGLERVADVVPEALDKGVHVTANVTRRGIRAFRNPRTTAIVVGVACVAAGAGLGVLAHHLLKKRLEKQYEERLEREIEEMRLFYMRRNKAGAFATPRTAAEALLAEDAVESLKKYRAEGSEDAEPSEELAEKIDDALQGKDVTEAAAKNQAIRYDKVTTNSKVDEAVREKVESVAQTVERNVFINGSPIVDDDWDAEAEEANRNPEVPYVISHDEFMENSFDHPQHSLTYYKGDDVLVDDRDEMISDVDPLIGTENLAHFGHGSRDANIVYIRNERSEADFEVALSQGKFSEEVMGLRHSDDNTFRLRRARWGDNE